MPLAVVKPQTLKELWRLLPALAPARKYLAGGTDLVNGANAGIDKSVVWVDISGLKELRGIKETKTSLLIGAGVKIAELEASPLVRRWLPVLTRPFPFRKPLKEHGDHRRQCRQRQPLR